MERKEFLHSLIKPSSSKKERHQRKAVITTMEIPEVVPPFSTGLDPYTGPWTETEIIHLLKRTMFGAAQEDVAYFKSRTVAQSVDELVNTVNANPGEPIKVAATDAASPASDPDWSIPIGRSWVSTGTSTNSNNGNRRDSLRSWWLGNMINQPRSIEEKMILFWSNHVTIEFAMVGGGLLCYGYMQLLRQHALGNFKILVKEMTINPAMLVYLNGYQNTKTAPDENYGRELQELFTVGKGPDSHYTEDDVKAAARVLTGYMVNLQNAYYSFAITKHDTEPKQFSSFYNNTVISRSQSEAQLEVDDLLNMIFSNVETSKNICRRLYRYFVYHDISPETEAAVITPLAETFRNNNYGIKPVLTQLLNSQHFFDTLQFGDTIKSPLDFTVGLIRECGVKLPPRSNPVLQYKHLNYLAANFMASIDQSIGDPNNVSGYMPYYQSPFYDKLWVNTDTFVKRQGFIDSLVNSGYSNGGFKTFIDPVAIASKMSSPANPNKLVQDFNTCFLRRSLSQGLRDTIKSEILLSGLTDDNYWTVAWNAYINNPSDLNNYSVVNTRLKALLLYFFSKLEECHLM